MIFNTAKYPGNATARTRLQAFFARGGGYIGAGTNGARFLTDGGLVTGLVASDARGNGRSGIVYWDNTGGPASIITAAYPARDTAIVDPPTWLASVPSHVHRRRPAPGRGLLRRRAMAERRRERCGGRPR